MSYPVFSIGHSTHQIEDFIRLLQGQDVSVVADVRSSPFSRFNPQYNKDVLARSLKEHEIKYVFLGKELGARSSDPSCYVNGRVQYALLAKTASFRSGLERLIDGARKHRIALMCAEREPLACHRTLLVSQALIERGISVIHIHGDGRHETHSEALSRLPRLVGLPQEDMFRTKNQLVAEALVRQEARIAYVEEDALQAAVNDTQ